MMDFNNFVENLEVLYVPLLGRSFTWSSSGNNEKWSRLGRFLIHPNWLGKFKFKQWRFPRNLSPRHLSDHCPILLEED